MNYGYAPLSAELAASAEPEKYCLQLYRHLFGDADLRGKKVVEVSCGRGGGAAHVAATYQPASYLGIDISERNLGLATQRFSKVPALSFQAGNAEALPLPDASCDALLNVEASHLYDNPARFFAEAFRVLEAGRHVFPCGSRVEGQGSAGHDRRRRASRCVEVEDITKNVVQALRARQRAPRSHRHELSREPAQRFPRLVGRARISARTTGSRPASGFTGSRARRGNGDTPHFLAKGPHLAGRLERRENRAHEPVTTKQSDDGPRDRDPIEQAYLPGRPHVVRRRRSDHPA